MTEPERPGSNPVWMDTTAVKQGGEWVINGRKWFTSSYDGAAFAIVMAVTDPEAPPHKRASQIIVPLDTPGFKFVRNIPIDRARRRMITTATPKSSTKTAACRWPTCWGEAGRDSPSRRSGWGPVASITACAGSASANAPST